MKIGERERRRKIDSPESILGHAFKKCMTVILTKDGALSVKLRLRADRMNLRSALLYSIFR